MRRLRRDADRICSHFGLHYRSIDAERANVKRRYGICYDDGSIKIRLRHVANGQPLKYSSLVNTLCHELAHLKHFNHGPHFQAFYARILAWARKEGVYRPGPNRVAARPKDPWPHASARPAPRAELGMGSRHRLPKPSGREPDRPAAAPNAPASHTRPVQLDLFAR